MVILCQKSTLSSKFWDIIFQNTEDDMHKLSHNRADDLLKFFTFFAQFFGEVWCFIAVRAGRYKVLLTYTGRVG